jgi:hypothetical protein
MAANHNQQSEISNQPKRVESNRILRVRVLPGTNAKHENYLFFIRVNSRNLRLDFFDLGFIRKSAATLALNPAICR